MTSTFDGITTVFLDDGGVLNDNSLRAPQWQRLVGEFLAPSLGGQPEAWGAANPAVFRSLWQGDFGPDAGQKFGSHRAWSKAYYEAWLVGMCKAADVPVPPAHHVQRIARDADDYITRRVSSAISGSAGAVRKLAGRGLVLHMGSGGDSRQLANYPEGMGIRDCFHTLYGADLVDMPKDRPEYHRRVLEDSGVDPERALFIDDSPAPLEWAASVGAKTALIAPDADGRFTFTAPSLAALVAKLLTDSRQPTADGPLKPRTPLRRAGAGRARGGSSR